MKSIRVWNWLPGEAGQASSRHLCEEWQDRQQSAAPWGWRHSLGGGSPTRCLTQEQHPLKSPPLLLKHPPTHPRLCQHCLLQGCPTNCIVLAWATSRIGRNGSFDPTSGHWGVLCYRPTNSCISTTDGMAAMGEARNVRWEVRKQQFLRPCCQYLYTDHLHTKSCKERQWRMQLRWRGWTKTWFGTVTLVKLDMT